MNISEVFKLDTWWKALLMLGILMCGDSVIAPIPILNSYYIFGLGIGFILIGVSWFKAQKFRIVKRLSGDQSGYTTIHTRFTQILFMAGVILSVVFLALTVIHLLSSFMMQPESSFSSNAN